MKILKNQVILRPTVLDYNGKKVVKKWEDIKKFIGKKVRVTLEHPSIDASTQDFAKGEEIGEVVIKKCPKGNALCADLPDHNKHGYSTGYGFKAKKEDGVLDGLTYDWWRKLNNIDHIALVADPRDPVLMKVAGDSIDPCSATDGNCYVNIYPKIGIGIDSYIFKEVDLMAENVEKLTAELKKSKQNAKDSADLAEKLKQQVTKLLTTRVSSAIDSLESIHGFGKETWKGKPAAFVEGALFALTTQKARDALSSGAQHQGNEHFDEHDVDGFFDVNDLILNDQGKLEIPK